MKSVYAVLVVLAVGFGCGEQGLDSDTETADTQALDDSGIAPETSLTDAADSSSVDWVDGAGLDAEVFVGNDAADGASVDTADAQGSDAVDVFLADAVDVFLNDAEDVFLADAMDAFLIDAEDGSSADWETGLDGSDALLDDALGDLADAVDVSSADSADDLAADAPVDEPICPDGAELGTSCSGGDCECATDQCYVLGPLGGVCSECEADADCSDVTGFGCNLPNPLSGVPATCSVTGGSGESCETDVACAPGLYCALMIAVPGIISSSSCSECVVHADCGGGQLCVPDYDLEKLGGASRCVSPQTIPNNEGCDPAGNGSECVSGNCTPASLQGIPVIGICSVCDEDFDCIGGTCVFPEVVIDGEGLTLVPGACE